MNLIEITHLTKCFPGFTLDDVSFSVPAGYVTGFVGANGSGKTTTLKSVLGLIHPDSGTATCLPKENVGVVFDVPPYHARWRVQDIASALRGFYPAWDDDVFHRHLSRGGIDASKLVGDLSRGMGMRLQLAAALAHHPTLLILDEPTSGLDPLARSELVDDIAMFMQDDSHAVLFSTHITTDLDRLADMLVVLNHGRVFAAGTTEDVLARYTVVRGRPTDLTVELRGVVLGLRETDLSWEGLLPAHHSDLLSPSIVVETPTIEQLAIAVAKGDRS